MTQQQQQRRRRRPSPCGMVVGAEGAQQGRPGRWDAGMGRWPPHRWPCGSACHWAAVRRSSAKTGIASMRAAVASHDQAGLAVRRVESSTRQRIEEGSDRRRNERPPERTINQRLLYSRHLPSADGRANDWREAGPAPGVHAGCFGRRASAAPVHPTDTHCLAAADQADCWLKRLQRRRRVFGRSRSRPTALPLLSDLSDGLQTVR